MTKPRDITVDKHIEQQMSARKWGKIGIILLLLALILLLRLPFHAQYLTKWDSCNFAFALEHYDIAGHTPHPPGYPVYILTAFIINFIVKDANLAFIIEGILLCWAAAAFIYLTGRMLFGFTTGFFAALLFIVSPASWYLSSAALSYMSDAALISVVLYLAILTHRYPSLRWPPVIMALSMGLGAGLRVPGFIICIPIYLLHLVDVSWVKRIASMIIILIIITGAYGWVINKTGGLKEYSGVVKTESVKHESAFAKLLHDPVREIKKNTGQILLFVLQSFGYMAIFLLVPLLFPRTLFRRLTRDKLFIWMALLVPMLLFTFVYINLSAIMLVLLPVLCLVMIRGIEKAALYLARKSVKSKDYITIKRLSELILFACFFIIILVIGTHYFSYEGEKQSPMKEFNLYRLYSNDLYVSSLVDTVSKNYPPGETCLLLSMEAKHAGYYLRDYPVIWDKYAIRLPSLAVPEIFSLYKGRRVMLQSDCIAMENNLICTVPLPNGCRTLIFRGDIKPLYFPLDASLEAYPVSEDISLWAIRNIPMESGIIVDRQVGSRENYELPPITWSVGPLALLEN